MKNSLCQGDSKHTKLLNTMGHPFPILENGLEREELMSKKHLEDTICTLSQMKATPSLNPIQMIGTHISCTPEFHPENKEMTLEDNPLTSNLNIPDMHSLKTLDQELIINDTVSEPFWNNCSKEMSKKLWLPTLTDSPDWDTISLNGCSYNSGQYWNLWRSQNLTQKPTWLTTSWKFSQSLQPVTMEGENTIVTRKIKIHPSKRQKELFQKCLNTHRYFYNKAISKINELYSERKQQFENSTTCVHCAQPKMTDSYCCEKHQKKALPWKLNISLITLRKLILKSDNEIKGTKDEWQTEIPYDTRQLAIKDAVSAYRSAVKNKMRGNIQHFQLGYKSRKSPSQLFWLDSNAIKNKNSKLQIFPRRFGKDCFFRIRKRQKQKLPESFEQDCKIMRYGKNYYLVYTFHKGIIQNETEKYPIVSLDPGVRTFQTGYSPSGVAFKVGDKQNVLLKRLHDRLDILRSKRDTARLKSKYNLRQKCLQLEHKIKNTVDNLHNQTSSFLTNTFEEILLPKFGTSVMQVGKELSPTTKRMMWTLSHYRFQEKLKHLCSRTGTSLYIVNEHHTTKTCGSCGILNQVGGSKIYNCSSCSYKLDRDIHGARNIMLKHITQYGISN